MAAKPQPAPSPSPAEQLFRKLPWTPENRRRIALAFIEEQGDIPAGVWHSFGMEARDSEEAEAINAEMTELRQQHFAKLGKPVPEYEGAALR